MFMARIHQDRDEGLDGSHRDLALADLRGEIRQLITNQHGMVVWSRAKDIGDLLVPTMSPSTIIKFATGETRSPSNWTIRKMGEVARKKKPRIVMIFDDKFVSPDGSIEIQ